ncbi:MAG: hypothetical protein KC609_23005 [Myxococcales bacterium]|nr:hypothetical protein [Myxococcales bacterium]
MKPPFFVPPPPDVDPSQRSEGEIHLQFEDISQDGRLLFPALPNAIGELMWRRLFESNLSTRELRSHGVIPILSRFAAQMGGGPITPRDRLRGRGCFQLAHEPDGEGGAKRLFINMWVDLLADESVARPRAADANWPRLGRIFAEHIFTRPFAPPEQRRVTSFDGLPALPSIPEAVHDFRPNHEVAALPAGAHPLEPQLNLDTVPTTFGLQHTDYNRHVNSLVYVRLFEESVLRRLAEMNFETGLLPTFVEIAYRKPFFAGNQIRFALRAFRHDESLGAVGAYVSEGDLTNSENSVARPYGTICIRFDH